MGRKPRSGSGGLFGRAFRSIISVVILSALIVGIVYLTKTLYNTSPYDLGKKTSSLLSLLHINVNEEQAGEVAGKFVERISQTNLGSGVSDSRPDPSATPVAGSISQPVVKVAILADIHQDAEHFSKALSKAKEANVNAVFILGDVTNYGDVNSLSSIKKTLDESGLTYYVLPGDHDLAQSVGITNFDSVFGTDHYKVTLNGITFLMLDNSANFSLIPSDQMSWFNQNISAADFVLLSQPLYTKGLRWPLDVTFMGSTWEMPEDDALVAKQKDVLAQGKEILSSIEDSSSVKATFAGDHHVSNEISDPIDTKLTHYMVGAVTSSLGDFSQNPLQESPRFTLLSVDKNGGYKVADVVLE